MKGLKRILKDKGLKHSWLAKELGFNKPKMSRIINGKQEATIPERFMICKILGCEDRDLDIK